MCVCVCVCVCVLKKKKKTMECCSVSLNSFFCTPSCSATSKKHIKGHLIRWRV